MDQGALNRSLWDWNLAEREVIRRPQGSGTGHWVGAPSVFQDADAIYLTYRFRRPRGEGRGYEARIARSRDGHTFEDIWRISQDELNSPSMERFALARLGGTYLLYISYVDGETNHWRTDVIAADRPDGFDPQARVVVFTPEALGLEAVKDPVVFPAYGGLFMYASVAERTLDSERVTDAELHASKDVYTSGLIRSGTGVAFSKDGVHFDWAGMVLEPSPGGWDGYAARVTTAVPVSPGYVLFYDGGADVGQNFEEQAGIAVTADLTHVRRLSIDGPALVSPHAPGTLRYIDYARRGDDLYFYYEIAEADGSHSLSLNIVPAPFASASR